MSFRSRLRRVEEAARAFAGAKAWAAMPLVVVCTTPGGQTGPGGDGVETRPPGWYERGRELVYATDADRERELARRYPDPKGGPLILILGPEEVPPPPGEPEDPD